MVKIPAVQTWLVHRISSYLSSDLKAVVSINKVEIKLFRSVVLKGLYIEDQKNDTLLYAKEMDAAISLFSFRKQQLVIDDVTLKDAHIYLKRYQDVKGLNFDFLLDYFSSSANVDTTKGWEIKLDKFKLNNATFSYHDYRWNDTTTGIDFEDMVVSHLDMEVENFQPLNDSIQFELIKLKGTEKSGFQVQNFSGLMSIGSDHLSVKNMSVKTKESNVTGAARLSFKDWDDFNDFIPKVTMTASFQKSTIASEDLKYFSKELIGLKKTIAIQGDIHGTVDNLKGKNLQISYTPNCFFKGDLSMKGLPDIDATFIDMMAKELRLNKKDIESIPGYPFAKGEKLNLPDNMNALGNIQFNGKFTGFYNDFVAYGSANTAIGFVSSDINFKWGNQNEMSSYSGTIITHQFNIGKLLKVSPEVGEISAKINIKGNSLILAKMEADLNGEISSLELKGYKYSGLKVNGHTARRLFTGALKVTDPNVDLDFNGTIDFSKPLPVFDFTADIRNAWLGKMNLIDDESANFSTRAELHCTGNKFDNINGTLALDTTNYTHLLQGITLNKFFMSSSQTGSKRDIELQSDFADAKMTGEFQLSTFFRSAAYILSKYIPAITAVGSHKLINQSFDYRVTFKETRGVLDVIAPELSVIAGTQLEGNFNTGTENFSALLKSDEIIYKGIRFGGLKISGITEDKGLRIHLMNKEIVVNDSLAFRNVVIAGITNRDSADFNLVVANTDSSLSRINWGFAMKFQENGYTTLKLIPNEFVIDRMEWQVDPTNYLLFDSTGVLVSNLNFSSGKQAVFLSGIIGNDSTAKMKIDLSEFNTSILNSILNIYSVQIGGIANGQLAIASITKSPVIQSEMNIRSFSWFGDTLGDADMSSAWNTSKKRVEINGFVTRGGEKNIAVNGVYLIKDKDDEMDFEITMQKTNVKSFGHYLKGLFSDISGIASGNFKLSGLVRAPSLTGIVHFQKVIFRVDYLNTFYNFTADAVLKEDEISFNDVVINDKNGNKAIVNGTITHDHLKDFYFDINIAAQNTLLLNTTFKDNELFYGVARGSGNVSISGYLDYIKLDIALRTEKGTEISIPLNNPEEVSRSSFITFIKTDTLMVVPLKSNLDLSGLEVNLDLDVTTDANIKLIFDDKIGDVIEGRGSGNLKMRENDADGFQMFGNYNIEQGQYTFTLQNIISKPFTIEKGGSISWAGNPYDADISLNAIYSKLRVNLYDLLQDTSSGYRKPLPVNLKLKLSGKLFNPVIGFDIEVPNIDAATSSRIQRYINTDEQKFKQAVSLLILRRFSPPDELANRPTANTSGAVGSNAYEFISQQFSNWASQINENVNVGINYNPGSALTQEQLELALSTSLFNDRITLETNVGVAGNNSGTTQNTSNIVGDFSVDVKARKDGKVRLKAFNRSNNNTLINNLNSQYTQGIGIFYREEFNTFGEIVKRWRERHRKKQEAASSSNMVPPK